VSAVERILPPLIGLVAFGAPPVYLLWQVWLAHRSRNWPSTTGRVLDARIRYDEHRLPRVYGSAWVRYEYHVDGRRYTGTRVKFGGWLNTDVRAAGRTVVRYRPGSPVSVRYDPRKPSRCTLERRLAGLVWIFLAIGLFMTGSIFGALMGWWE